MAFEKVCPKCSRVLLFGEVKKHEKECPGLTRKEMDEVIEEAA